MMIDAIRRCVRRDLDTLAAELAAYPDDAAVWALPAGAPNSAGTLTLHLAGNLRHFIGASFGHTGYLRQRELEFSTRDLPRAELLALIATTRDEVEATFAALDASILDAPYALPLPPTSPDHDRVVPTGRFLVHLATHLSYHLGQVDFHRRLTTGDGTSVGAMGLAPLF
jgi:uncharacterized damage-inducible protein DinB